MGGLLDRIAGEDGELPSFFTFPDATFGTAYLPTKLGSCGG